MVLKEVFFTDHLSGGLYPFRKLDPTISIEMIKNGFLLSDVKGINSLGISPLFLVLSIWWRGVGLLPLVCTGPGS